ncbi:hypothetical protein D3C80_2028840 [compost metagenome]
MLRTGDSNLIKCLDVTSGVLITALDREADALRREDACLLGAEFFAIGVDSFSSCCDDVLFTLELPLVAIVDGNG